MGNAPRKNLERETGIEPATNSLEGCDSTTELLPPTRSLTCSFALQRASPPYPKSLRSESAVAVPTRQSHNQLVLAATAVLACRPQLAASQRAKAGGEGRIRTSEGLGRQIYSLLRLTASLPRRAVAPTFQRRRRVGPLTAESTISLSGFAPLATSRGNSLELAKGFEPPTG